MDINGALTNDKTLIDFEKVIQNVFYSNFRLSSALIENVKIIICFDCKKALLQNSQPKWSVRMFENILKNNGEDVWELYGKQIAMLLKYFFKQGDEMICKSFDKWWLFVRNFLPLLTEYCQKAQLVRDSIVWVLSKRLLNIVTLAGLLGEHVALVLHHFNPCLKGSSQDIRDILMVKLHSYIAAVASLVPQCGDYPLQAAIMETLLLWLGPAEGAQRRESAKVWFHGEEHSYLRQLFSELTFEEFNWDCRKFLNELNKLDKKVVSIECERVFIGNIELFNAEGPASCPHQSFWVDFNSGSRTASTFCDMERLQHGAPAWDTITAPLQHVSKLTYTALKHTTSSSQLVTLQLHVPVSCLSIEGKAALCSADPFLVLSLPAASLQLLLKEVFPVLVPSTAIYQVEPGLVCLPRNKIFTSKSTSSSGKKHNIIASTITRNVLAEVGIYEKKKPSQCGDSLSPESHLGEHQLADTNLKNHENITFRESPSETDTDVEESYQNKNDKIKDAKKKLIVKVQRDNLNELQLKLKQNKYNQIDCLSSNTPEKNNGIGSETVSVMDVNALPSSRQIQSPQRHDASGDNSNGIDVSRERLMSKQNSKIQIIRQENNPSTLNKESFLDESKRRRLYSSNGNDFHENEGLTAENEEITNKEDRNLTVNPYSIAKEKSASDTRRYSRKKSGGKCATKVKDNMISKRTRINRKATAKGTDDMSIRMVKVPKFTEESKTATYSYRKNNRWSFVDRKLNATFGLVKQGQVERCGTLKATYVADEVTNLWRDDSQEDDCDIQMFVKLLKPKRISNRTKNMYNSRIKSQDIPVFKMNLRSRNKTPPVDVITKPVIDIGEFKDDIVEEDFNPHVQSNGKNQKCLNVESRLITKNKNKHQIPNKKGIKQRNNNGIALVEEPEMDLIPAVKLSKARKGKQLKKKKYCLENNRKMSDELDSSLPSLIVEKLNTTELPGDGQKELDLNMLDGLVNKSWPLDNSFATTSSVAVQLQDSQHILEYEENDVPMLDVENLANQLQPPAFISSNKNNNNIESLYPQCSNRTPVHVTAVLPAGTSHVLENNIQQNNTCKNVENRIMQEHRDAFDLIANSVIETNDCNDKVSSPKQAGGTSKECFDDFSYKDCSKIVMNHSDDYSSSEENDSARRESKSNGKNCKSVECIECEKTVCETNTNNSSIELCTDAESEDDVSISQSQKNDIFDDNCDDNVSNVVEHKENKLKNKQMSAIAVLEEVRLQKNNKNSVKQSTRETSDDCVSASNILKCKKSAFKIKKVAKVHENGVQKRSNAKLWLNDDKRPSKIHHSTAIDDNTKENNDDNTFALLQSPLFDIGKYASHISSIESSPAENSTRISYKYNNSGSNLSYLRKQVYSSPEAVRYKIKVLQASAIKRRIMEDDSSDGDSSDISGGGVGAVLNELLSKYDEDICPSSESTLTMNSESEESEDDQDDAVEHIERFVKSVYQDNTTRVLKEISKRKGEIMSAIEARFQMMCSSYKQAIDNEHKQIRASIYRYLKKKSK